MLTVEEARDHIMRLIPVLPAEQVMLTRSLGRVLAQPVETPRDLPSFANSVMDGYAVRFDDVVSLGVSDEITLPVAFEIPAGRVVEQPLPPRSAARIMTGAPMPAGADTVIMQEDTRRIGSSVTIVRLPEMVRGANVRQAGEYAPAGERLLPSGHRIDAAAVALLASIGRCSLSVHRRPRVALVATGDELVEIDRQPEPGQIVNSSTYMLRALIKQAGGLPTVFPTAPDQVEPCRILFEQAISSSDMVISIGGVSVGDYDVVRRVMSELGAQMGFWRVRMKPGKPLAFGLVEGVALFGLPGNPVSSFTSFQQFVRPAILRARGERGGDRLERVVARLTRPIRSEKERREFLRGRLFSHEDQMRFTPYPHQGSGNILSLLQANGFGVVPEGVDRLAQDDTITVERIPSIG